MATEMLSYRQLGQRLGCSRDAARELVKQLRLPRHKANDGKALVSVDLSEINHPLMPTHVTASLKKRIESKLEATAAGHQAELERERERAERLMAELLRAKADALASRAMVTRLEGELAALRSRPWWRRLGRTRQPSGSFDVPQMDTNVQALA
jgi:regulator of protease activity HflC (stomatin/prohibitin superfamily)